MPTPPLVEPVAPDSGALPIYSSDDVWALAPAEVRNSPAKPLCDNLVEALTEVALGHQDGTTLAAQQCDVAQATDQFLDGLGDDREVFRAPDEENGALQDRMVAVPDLVDRLAILAAVNAVLDPITSVKAQLFDSILDRMYMTDGSASYHTFFGEDPSYTDRLFADDTVENEGDVRPQSSPGGCWMFSDHVGRYFVLRVPELGSIDADHAFMYDSSIVSGGIDIDPEQRMFMGDGSQGDPAAYMSLHNSTALTVYQTIADKVESIIGAGIRWALIVDPNLT